MITLTQDQLANILMEAMGLDTKTIQIYDKALDSKSAKFNKLMERAGIESLQNEIIYGKK